VELTMYWDLSGVLGNQGIDLPNYNTADPPSAQPQIHEPARLWVLTNSNVQRASLRATFPPPSAFQHTPQPQQSKQLLSMQIHHV
ncbi:hypothetical protein LTR66_002592, partial [Elasticomyces elasticus]